jgi:hypothetical protein
MGKNSICHDASTQAPNPQFWQCTSEAYLTLIEKPRVDRMEWILTGERKSIKGEGLWQ